MILGQGEYKYERVEGWAKIPPYFQYRPVDAPGRYLLGIRGDSQGRVFVTFQLTNHPVVIFDPDGSFIYCWGEGHVLQPHGIFIGPDDSVYIADRQAHTVEKFTPAGDLLRTWGTRFEAGVVCAQIPFNMPTAVTLGPSGDMYVADGYGNSVVHRFSPEPEGKLLNTWGGLGSGPGQFIIPHAVGVDRYGYVYVCDRLNERIQKFTADGKYVTAWTDVRFPMDIHIDRENDIIYVLETLDYHNWPERLPSRPRISIRNLEGNVLSEFGGRESEGEGVLEIGHAIWVNPEGDIYEGEAVTDCRIQRFARIK